MGIQDQGGARNTSSLSAPVHSVISKEESVNHNMGSNLAKYDEMPFSTASGGLEPLPTGGRWVRDENAVLTLQANRFLGGFGEATIYEGDGKVLFKIARSDSRWRAVSDRIVVEIPTGYQMRGRWKITPPVARIYWRLDGKVMIYATVKPILTLRPWTSGSFGIHMHNPPLELNAMHEVVLKNPEYRVVPAFMHPSRFRIMQYPKGDDEKPVKVATVKDVCDGVPRDITIGPKVDLLFPCLVIAAVQELFLEFLLM